MSTRSIVSDITRRLKARDVIVEAQPAITTSSVYLTFDYGVLKAARVGDHKGKSYNYTFEIGDHVPEYQEIPKEYNGNLYVRYRYPANATGDLVMQVLINRSNLWSKYGKERYAQFMDKAKSGN